MGSYFYFGVSETGTYFPAQQVCVCHIVTIPNYFSALKNANSLLPAFIEGLPQ